VATAGVLAAASLWAALFGYLAVERHLAGGSHAEDLGFTDQVLSNFLRGQWFRMSIYQGATWNTEIDIGKIARPDSLLAFHVEPMLLLLVPMYAVGGGVVALLVLQAVALAAGAVPAYRLGSHVAQSSAAGLAVAAAYLLSPLGQWAVLSDFHTSTLAAPLLLLALERLVVARSNPQALASAGLALTAREDVGPVVAALGVLVILVYRRAWRTGLALTVLGAVCTVGALAIIHAYSGGASPFGVRYGSTLAGGPASIAVALVRPTLLQYAGTLAVSGGWLALLAPPSLLPALPSLALNALSSSPWMVAGKAHYSGLVLPFIVGGTAAALGRLRHTPGLARAASVGLIVSSVLGYSFAGAGPFGGNFAPAVVTDHASTAAAIADTIPSDAKLSATSSLVPLVSRRPGVYVFPAVLDADYVFLDLRASPAPTSAGDVYLHVRDQLTQGGWRVDTVRDGLLLLERAADAPPIDLTSLSTVPAWDGNSGPEPITPSSGDVSLLGADLVPSPDGAIDVDGQQAILRTIWRAERPLERGTRLEFVIDLDNGEQLHAWDLASLWWNPPERWNPGQPVIVDVRDVPARHFKSWQAMWTR
jgi:uncharacterized membrane protein